MSWDTGCGYVKVAMRANSLVTAFLLLKSSCDFVSHGCICYYVAFDLLFCCHPVFVVLGYPKLPFGRPRGSILAPWGAILTPCCCSRGSRGRPKGHLGVHISIFVNFWSIWGPCGDALFHLGRVIWSPSWHCGFERCFLVLREWKSHLKPMRECA